MNHVWCSSDHHKALSLDHTLEYLMSTVYVNPFLADSIGSKLNPFWVQLCPARSSVAISCLKLIAEDWVQAGRSSAPCQTAQAPNSVYSGISRLSLPGTSLQSRRRPHTKHDKRLALARSTFCQSLEGGWFDVHMLGSSVSCSLGSRQLTRFSCRPGRTTISARSLHGSGKGRCRPPAG